MKQLSKQTPEEIDAQLFPLWADRYVFSSRAYDNRLYVAATIFPKAEVMRSNGRSRDRVRRLSTPHELQRFVEYMQENERKLTEAEALIAPLDAEYDKRGGWKRYVLVSSRTAKAGHLHYRHCHTLRPTTQILLVAEASGLDAVEVVGKFGETACSHCFPDAPTEDDPERTSRPAPASPPVVEKPAAKTTKWSSKPETRKEIDLDRAQRAVVRQHDKIEQLKQQLADAERQLSTLVDERERRHQLVPTAQVSSTGEVRFDRSEAKS